MAQNQELRFALIFSLLGAIALHGLLYWMSRAQVIQGLPDFSIFYTAGLIVRRGQASRLYDDALQQAVQSEFTVGSDVPLPYNHPPFEALLYVPLTYFPYLRAYFLWVLADLLLLLGISRFLRPYLPALTSFLPKWTWFVGAGFFPAAYALMQGQDSILLLLAYTLAFVSLRSGKEFRAGAVLALGLFKFHLVLPFVFVLFLRRMWRFVLGFALSAAAVGLVSAAIVGWRELFYYPHYVWRINRVASIRVIIPRNMPNLRGLISGWSWRLPTGWSNGLIAIASVALLVWAASEWEVSRRENLPLWEGGFSIAVVATFLSSYHAYNQDMSMVLLPAFLLFDRLLAGREKGWRTKILALCLSLLFFSPLYLILTLHYQHQNLFSLVLLSFAIAIALWTRRIGRRVSGQPGIAITTD
jgi:Glycosyltransferase family 87